MVVEICGVFLDVRIARREQTCGFELAYLPICQRDTCSVEADLPILVRSVGTKMLAHRRVACSVRSVTHIAARDRPTFPSEIINSCDEDLMQRMIDRYNAHNLQ